MIKLYLPRKIGLLFKRMAFKSFISFNRRIIVVFEMSVAFAACLIVL